MEVGGVGSLGCGVMGIRCGYRELNLGPPKGQEELLTTVPSLQPALGTVNTAVQWMNHMRIPSCHNLMVVPG